MHALTDNWTHGAASRHSIAPISHTRPSPRIRSYYSFPVPLRVGGWVGLSTQWVSKQWTGCESNPQLLGYETDTLPTGPLHPPTVDNPLIGTLKPQRNGPLYCNMVIGTLAVDGWAVTFGSAKTDLGELRLENLFDGYASISQLRLFTATERYRLQWSTGWH